MQELVGRVVNAIYVEDGEEAIIFSVPGTQVKYNTYGDCCSETWFADIVGVKSLLGLTVRRVEEIHLPEELRKYGDVAPLDRSRQQEDEYYGVRVFTDLGSCDFIYRNSSNGYYGGNIEYAGETGVMLQESTNWTKIEADWQASSPPNYT